MAHRLLPRDLSSLGGLRDLPPDPNVWRASPGVPVGPDETLEALIPWLNVCPPWGKMFDKGLQITLGASASRSEVAAFQVQAGFIGILRFFGNGVASPSDAPFVTFNLTKDGQAVQGYYGIAGPKCDSIYHPDDLVVPLGSGTRIAVLASNSSAVAIQGVSARIKGWIWNPTMGPRSG